MAQILALDTVIKKINAYEKPDADAQKIIIINAKNRKVVKKNILGSFGNLRYYRVSNDSDALNIVDKIEIPGFRLPGHENSVDVSLSLMAVSCRPGNEEQVASALFHKSDSPVKVLEGHIIRWFIEYSRYDLNRLIENYFKSRGGLQDEIKTWVLKETGLSLFQVTLSLDAEKSSGPIPVVKDHLAIRVKDYGEEQDLSLEAELEVDEGNKTNAILHYSKNQELNQLVLQEVRSYIKQNVSMQQFCTELNHGPVKEKLINHLNDALKPAGRKVSPLNLKPAIPDNLQFFFQDQRDVICEVQEYPEPILINNKVQMILTDIARYKAANSPDLKSWLKERLDRIVSQCLFYTRYIDLLIRFEPIKECIKFSLSAEAEIIGYEIKQLITVPDLEPIKWKDNFPVPSEDATFETRLRNVHVKLHIVVTARIPDLEKIETFLNQQQNIPDLMRQSVIDVTTQFLHTVEPERFYMQFKFPDKVGEKSVERELIELIRKELTEKYHAEVINVIPKVVDTDLMIRFKELQETICPFTVEIRSLHGGESVVFKGKFNVDTVDPLGWHKFQMRNYKIDQIKQHLEEYVGATLRTFPSDLLVYKDHDRRTEIETLIKALVEKNVAEEFGLIININTVYREHTVLEAATNQQQIGRYEERLRLAGSYLDDKAAADMEINQEKLTQVRKLLERRTYLTTQTGTEEEIAEIDEKIRQIREGFAPESIPSIEEVENIFLSNSARKASLTEFSRLLAAPKSTNNNGQEEGD